MKFFKFLVVTVKAIVWAPINKVRWVFERGNPEVIGTWLFSAALGTVCFIYAVSLWFYLVWCYVNNISLPNVTFGWVAAFYFAVFIALNSWADYQLSYNPK